MGQGIMETWEPLLTERVDSAAPFRSALGCLGLGFVARRSRARTAHGRETGILRWLVAEWRFLTAAGDADVV